MPPIPNRPVSAGTRSTTGAGVIKGAAGLAEVAGRGRDAGLRVCRRRRRVAVLCLTVGPAARTSRRRVGAHRRADRHDRVDPPDCRRREGGAVLPCRREMARGTALLDDPGVLPLRASRAGQGDGQRGRAATGSAISRVRVGRDLLAKALHAWAVGCFRPMAATKVRCPGRPVPTVTPSPARALPGPPPCGRCWLCSTSPRGAGRTGTGLSDDGFGKRTEDACAAFSRLAPMAGIASGRAASPEPISHATISRAACRWLPRGSRPIRVAPPNRLPQGC